MTEGVCIKKCCSPFNKQLHTIQEAVCNKKDSESEIELTLLVGDVRSTCHLLCYNRLKMSVKVVSTKVLSLESDLESSFGSIELYKTTKLERNRGANKPEAFWQDPHGCEQ